MTQAGEGEETVAPQISTAALERWQTFADDAPLDVRLTKADLDNLLLALRNLAIGQSELVAALSAHTDQDLGGCVDSMMRASELSRLAFGRINALVAAVMDKAEPAAAGA
ncbi:hypothetical protein EZH22_15020 [Xanthobacter dioxanivorans]|uniref:Uncharacterized protein n=1 Tax=Xanthobacter dioxanivorans TaxID=2528964 RepID=A0A974SGM9_9HYPH|nr:hypothetical protein [Xanthobacter dioxanivorans]QRG04507.1 hypothetical protein EZH22_15020 [Xanthobacter dioxanivorans]